MQMKLYLENSVVSYLTARPSRDVITVARQELTRDWWRNQRERYELYISEFVVSEASDGDPEAAARRLDALDGIPVLGLGETAIELAEKFVEEGPLPEKATVDAFHIAMAVVNGMDYLLTWNFKHIANALLRHRIEEMSRAEGYEPPVICTPEELLGE